MFDINHVKSMIFKFFNQLVKILFLTIFLNSCGGLPPPAWSKRTEVDGKKRAQQNVIDGKGFNLLKSKKRMQVIFHLLLQILFGELLLT